MPLLYYWRRDNYVHDLDWGAGYHLNQANPLLHQIDIGDSLWAFTRTKKGRYALAAELIVRAKTLNPPNFRYGRYRVWGDLHRSRYFRVDGQPGVEQLIRHLSCRATAEILGRSFQGHAAVRALNFTDHLILVRAAMGLALEPRARLLPEERLEATVLLGNAHAVERLVRAEAAGVAERRQTYLYSEAPARNRELLKELQELYEGRCQLCLWDPRDRYGRFLCHGHHVQWLSRGGEDSLDNLCLVCPSHHAAIHGCDAPLDYRDLSFDFGTRREAIQVNLHLGGRETL